MSEPNSLGRAATLLDLGRARDAEPLLRDAIASQPDDVDAVVMRLDLPAGGAA